ncbi:MAG: CPBP family intramembrane glutamic endopeptidase [Pseudomonadota bacterium]
MTGGFKQGSVAPFIVLAYGVSWSCWIYGWQVSGRPDDYGDMILWLFAGSFGPFLSAAFLLLVRGENLVAWLRAFVKIRAAWSAYLLALVALPLVCLALTFAFNFTPRADVDPLLAYLTLFPVSILNGLAVAIASGGPLGEEGGWRGYLLPRLLKTQSIAGASATVGVFWALWHIPVMYLFADWRDGLPFWIYLPVYVAGVVPLSYVFTRLWLLSKGSIFLCIWFHGIVNAVGGFAFQPIWEGPYDTMLRLCIFTLALWVLALLTAMLFRSTIDGDGPTLKDSGPVS